MSNVIKKESLPLESQIKFLLGDIKREGEALLRLEYQLDCNPIEEVRNTIVDNLASTIIKYSNIKQELRSKLEELFAHQERDGIPRDINFYRVYRELIK